MVDSVRRANFLSVVQRRRAVSVGKNEDMRWWEDFEGCFKSGCNKIGRLVAGDEKSSVSDVVLNLGFGSELGWWRVLLKDDEERGKGVTVASLVYAEVKMQ